jgi:NADH dehydrogenase (ubiquinone) 1 alpha/beta subcomplex 1
MSSSMQRVFAAVRQGVLGRVRLQPTWAMGAAAASPLSLQFLRGFADASFLDKKDVTDRVLNVVKNFEKVDAAKVRRCVVRR